VFKDVLKNLKIYSIIEKMLNVTAYGFQVFEIMWQDIGGLLLPVDLVQKPSRWFCFSPTNELLFKSQNNPLGEVVPPNKFIVIANEANYDNPYGTAVLSQCFWAATFKKGGLKFWVKFTEKFGIPWVIGKTPVSWPQDDVDKLVTTLTTMVQDGVLVAPETVDVSLHYPSSASVDIFDRLLQFCKDEISMSFLGHTKAGQSTPGQLGNNDQAVDVRGDIVMADKRMVEDTINEFIKLIYSVNYTTGNAPKFVMYEESDVDLNLATRDKVLWDMGIRYSEDYIKKHHFLEDGDFTIESAPAMPKLTQPPMQPTDKSQPAPTDNMTPSDTNPDAPAFAAEPDVPSGQLIIDKKLDDMLRNSKEIIGNLTKPVKDYLKGKTEFQSAIDGLAQIYPKMNSTELYDQLVKIQFAAELVGRLEVQSELRGK